MTIYDISLPLSSDLPVWPGDDKIRLVQTLSMDAGADANVSRIEAGVHSGTHVDAPHHFLNDGRTVETLSLEVLVGPAYVLRIPDDVSLITADSLSRASIPEGVSRLLLRTRNSRWWQRGDKEFHRDFVAITVDGAAWLVAHDIRLVGVDYLSVAPFDDGVPTHRILLEAGIVIIEGCDLSRVPQGEYDIYCLPLKLIGAEGAPARTILVSK